VPGAVVSSRLQMTRAMGGVSHGDCRRDPMTRAASTRRLRDRRRVAERAGGTSVVRRTRVVGALALLTLSLALSLAVPLASAASAQEDDTTESPGPDEPEFVRGRIRDENRRPVAGVELSAEADGREVGTAVTNDEGEWEIALPGPGTYSVTLDTDTLPEGVALRDEDRDTLEVDIQEGRAKGLIFAVGERTSTKESTAERLLNLGVQGVRLGAVIALASVGLSLVFGVTGLVNFAHGEIVSFGALVAFFLSASAGGPGIPLVAAIVLTVVIGGLFGWALEMGLFRRLRRRKSGNVALIVVSIGLGLLLRNVYLIIFGERPRPYTEFTIQKDFDIGPIALPPKDYVIMGVCFAVLILVGVLLQATRVGTALRAVADDRDLSEASGINVERIILLTWVAGAALAGLGGVFQGITDRVTYDMGFNLLLLMFAAVILGGIGTAYGAMVGGLFIGVVTEVSTYWVESKYKLAVAFSVLILAVLLRPQGLLGQSERVG
jgi:neutral amino acid transport system permease protein